MKPQLNLKPKSVARGIPSLCKHFYSFPVEHNFTIPASSLEAASNHLNNTLNAFDLKWQYRPSQAVGIGFANQNSWSRAARRHRKHQNTNAGTPHTGATQNNDKKDANEEEQDEEEQDEEKTEQEKAQWAKFGFKVKLTQTLNMNGIHVQIRWMTGTDCALFESFCGMLRSHMMSL